MSAACYCDTGDIPALYVKTTVRARKAHHCAECGNRMQVGEAHEAVRSLHDGHFSTTRTCPRCLEVRAYVTAHAPCFCWMHHTMLDDARDTLREYGSESAGFWIGGMKRVLRAERGVAA